MNQFLQNQKALTDAVIHASSHHTIDIGDEERTVIACIECDEEICPECQSNLVESDGMLICQGCGLTAGEGGR